MGQPCRYSRWRSPFASLAQRPSELTPRDRSFVFNQHKKTASIERAIPMRRRKPILILVLLGLSLSLAGQTAFAWNPFECASDAWYSVCRDWKRNNCWPEPFVCPDRTAVRMPFAIQIANGWRSRNTLDDVYFKDAGSELSELGQNRIRYLLMNTPRAYRRFTSNVYVIRTLRRLDWRPCRTPSTRPAEARCRCRSCSPRILRPDTEAKKRTSSGGSTWSG